jgi:hypothetical protein
MAPAGLPPYKCMNQFALAFIGLTPLLRRSRASLSTLF